MATATRSWWARAILIGSVVALTLLVIGPLGTRLGIWPFTIGLLMIPASMLLALIGIIVGLIALLVSRKRGYSGDGPLLIIGIVVCGAIFGPMLALLMKGFSVPAIHNISTDVVDPPAFEAVVALRGPGTNPLEYDPAKLAEQQQSAYPDVTTLELSAAVPETVSRVVAALEAMGLEIVASNPQTGIVEATATTFWFGFKDDLVVRVRPAAGGGSLVDVRSVSRVGQSDLGANAARIRELLARLD